MKRLFVLLALMTLAAESYAATIKNPDSVTIKSYRIQANGTRFSVEVENNAITVSPVACNGSSSTSVFYIVLDSSSEATRTAYDQLFSSVVAAKFAGTPIDIWVNDTLCSSSLPIVELIRVN